ncbi:fibronectin type III domain-containing protein [candidate division KSB1 bacterium]|nr:fibronectin type III domain-containing protein [candidate division KSB1 bacterium]
MRYIFLLLLFIVTPCFSRAVTLQWNPVDDVIMNYRLYWGQSSRNYTDWRDVGDRTTYTLNELQEGVRYYFVVTAIDYWGNESGYSNEVHSSGEVVVPARYELKLNYPNPFNSGTSFDFDLPEDVTIDITIYNAVGQRIKVLEQGDFAAGSYRTHWDGTDFTNNMVSSGAYICALQAGVIRLTRSITLLR